MNAQVVAYCILFFAIFVTGFVAGDMAGDDFRSAFWHLWRWLKKNKFNFVKRSYWYNRKLKKQGIIKQVLCLMDSYSTVEETHLVKAGNVYNVIEIREYSNLNWGDIRGAYCVKETGEHTQHSRSVFIDYYGQNVNKLMRKHQRRTEQLNDWLQAAIKAEKVYKQKQRIEQINKFKFLK